MARAKPSKSNRTSVSSYSKGKIMRNYSHKITAKCNGQKYFQLEEHVYRNTLWTAVEILFINF